MGKRKLNTSLSRCTKAAKRMKIIRAKLLEENIIKTEECITTVAQKITECYTESKIATWRARNVTAYMAEFLPPEPVPLPVHDSVPSLTDESCVVTDVIQFDPLSIAPEEEGADDNDSWLLHRQQFLEETEQKE